MGCLSPSHKPSKKAKKIFSARAKFFRIFKKKIFAFLAGLRDGLNIPIGKKMIYLSLDLLD